MKADWKWKISGEFKVEKNPKTKTVRVRESEDQHGKEYKKILITKNFQYMIDNIY